MFSLAGCDLFSFGLKSKAVLQVGSQTFTLTQFSKALAYRLKDLDPLSAKDPAVLKTFKNKIATDFIVDSLIEKWFTDQKLKLDAKALEDELSSYISGFPSDRAFREELASQNMSYQDWRHGVELGLKRKALFIWLKKQVGEPTDTELEAYYQNNKLKYFQNESVQADTLLLQDAGQADVIKALYKKNTFENLFKEYSLDKTTPESFKYGWVERIPGSDFEALFLSKKNELIGPLHFSEGYRIFKITARRQSHQRTFDEVKAQIKTEVLALRETARFSAWLDEQIKISKILKNQQALDALVVETRDN